MMSSGTLPPSGVDVGLGPLPRARDHDEVSAGHVALPVTELRRALPWPGPLRELVSDARDSVRDIAWRLRVA